MRPFWEDDWLRVYQGDCREVMAQMPAESVHCVVTSPPYWGLRDYGTPGQLGLEPTPEEYVANMVAVFREVRRVLRNDGTVWLNLGDSYSGNATSGGINGNDGGPAVRVAGVPTKRGDGLKPKDLVGIPWLVARALQEPYYAGNMKREGDRRWLAAMIDGEGTIAGFHHIREDDGRPRTGVHLYITNSSTALLDEAARIWPASRSEHSRAGAGHLGNLTVWRWIVHGIANKTLALRELYPYLIAKRRQALLAYNLLVLMADAKRLGHTAQRDEVRDKRQLLVNLISRANHGDTADVPSWCVEPPSVLEPGWYLRSDIIWSKPNPMPESVTDRPTKSHEYIFLLSKSPRYFFDQDAVREGVAESTVSRLSQAGLPDQEGSWRVPGKTNGAMKAVGDTSGRNMRSVWTIATQPYPGQHFAVFPRKLVEPCIKAGTSERGVCPECGAPWVRVVERVPVPRDITAHRGTSRWAEGAAVRNDTDLTRSGQEAARWKAANPDHHLGWRPSCAHDLPAVPSVVLDCFAGSGTTALVAQSLGRRAILIDLSTDYMAQIMRRNAQMPLGGLSA